MVQHREDYSILECSSNREEKEIQKCKNGEFCDPTIILCTTKTCQDQCDQSTTKDECSDGGKKICIKNFNTGCYEYHTEPCPPNTICQLIKTNIGVIAECVEYECKPTNIITSKHDDCYDATLVPPDETPDCNYGFCGEKIGF